MWLFKLDIYIKQIIPPTWRENYKESIITTLCSPIIYIYNAVYDARASLPTKMNLNAQKGVIEGILNNVITQSRYPYIEFLDTKKSGQVNVLIHKDYWHSRKQVENMIRKVLPFGFQLIIEQKQS